MQCIKSKGVMMR